MSGSQQLLLGGIPTVTPVDPYFYSVTSLLHGDGTNGGQNNTFLDSSSNNFTITRNGNTTQGSFSPFSQTGWSGYFNGSSDYISVADSADFTMGSGDFTIQCWVYSTSNSGSDQYILGQVNSGGTAAATSFQLYKKATSNVAEAFVYAGSSKVATGTAQIPVGQWTHLAMVRDGGTLRLYVNGSQDGTNATLSTTAITDSAGSFSVGRTGDYNGLYFAGYVSNVSVVKGTCLFPSGTTFTPSTTPLSTSTSGQSVLLCQANRFIDTNTATTAKTVTVGSTSSIQPFSPFNPITPYSTSAVGGSGYFDGSGDYLSMTSGTSLGSGNFTIGCWVYLTAAPGAETPVGSSYNYYTSGQNGNFVFRVGTTNLWRSFDGQGNQASITGTYTWTLNTWMYMAWVRSGSTLTVYKDGVSLGSVTDSKTLSDSANGYAIGADRINGSIGTYLTGYLSGFRILVGTADSTVPTAPPTAIANTQLLCNFTNGAIFDNAAVADYETVGNAQISTSVKKYGTGSIAFDGTGDYLLTDPPSAQLMAFGTGDFTVEMWVYFNAIGTNVYHFYDSRPASTDGAYPTLRTNASAQIEYVANSAVRITGLTLTTNTWYHVALCRTASQTKLFVNGTQTGSTYADTTNYLNAAARPLIGGSGFHVTTLSLNGYVDDVRISKGVARYPYNFTPPTAEFPNIGGTVTLTADPYFDYTTLLLPGNGTNGAQNNTFLDSSTNAFSITRNGNTTQGTFSPFSQTGWGNYFDGTGDYLSVPDAAAFTLGTSDFCMESWVYPVNAGTGASESILGQWSSASYGWIFQYRSNKLLMYYSTNGSSTTNAIDATATVVNNAWNHIAFVRSGNTLSAYVNGVRVSTNASFTASIVNSSSTVNVGRNGDNSEYVTGYLSNTRLVVGSSVYDPTQASFTVPTAPLTAITNTSLLTCQSNRFIDNSSNNFAITRNGDVSVQAFSPFNPTAAWSAATNGGSGYFDGSGDYLTATNDTAINPGTGDFTLECWVYAAGAVTNDSVFEGSQNGLVLAFNASSQLAVAQSNVAYIVNDTVAFTLNEWVHVAVVRSGTTLSLFKNGSRVATATNSTNFVTNTENRIGRSAGTDYFTGYISNLRFVKGTAVYSPSSTTLTVPTAPVTAISGTGLLLNCTNAAIYDATSKNDLETVGNAQISTTQSKFGGSSMYFDGTGDYIVTPSSVNLQYGTGDFTIEFWWYPTTLASLQTIIYHTNDSGVVGAGEFVIVYNTSVGIRFYVNSGAIDITQGSTSGWSANNWYHVAVARYGNTLTIYRNGISVASGSVSGTTVGANVPTYIGGEPFDPFYMTGYINDLRITKGIARYTSNFTPPSTAFLTL